MAQPRTDAEYELRRAQTRRLTQIAATAGIGVIGIYLLAPAQVIEGIASRIPANAPRMAAQIPLLLIQLYPWVQYGVLLTLLGALGHLIVAWRLAGVQARHRARRMHRTLHIETPLANELSPMHGVDFFVGLQRLNSTQGQWTGDETTFVFALVSGPDGRMRLHARAPVENQRDWSTMLRQAIEGRAPGSTARLLRNAQGEPVDDLQEAIAQARQEAAATNLRPVLGWIDVTLARNAAYPINDLGQFASDPMGVLAAAVRAGPQIRYAAYEVIIRGAEPRWRDMLRAQIAQIEARLSPEDLAAHEVLLRKAEHVAYDVVVRCIAIGINEASTRQHLADMRDALWQFDRITRGASQRLQQPLSDRLYPGGARGRIIPLVPPAPVHRSWQRGAGMLAGAALAGALLGAGMALIPGAASLWPCQPFPLPPPPLLDLRGALPPLPIGGRSLLGAVLGTGIGWSLHSFSHPERQRQRYARDLALIAAHAHRFVWPGPPWPIPVPGRQRSIMGVFDLAALWHAPAMPLGSLVAYRSVQYLPAPEWTFLRGEAEEQTRRGITLPEPTTPGELARRRIGLAIADRPDGSPGFIGPTVRDLRKGMECLGPMGSGKSCFLEVLAYELARVGAGYVLIDAKGDLADRMIAILPPAAERRVILVDVSRPMVPCINPLDRRLLQEGMTPAQLVGHVERLFERIDPETWPTSMGMQQFVRMGLRALLEGEAGPTLLHLDRFYTSSVYRSEILDRVRNPIVLDFWRTEYPRMDMRLKISVDSFRRRLQNFITDPLFQQLFCQVDSTLYLPELMDQRRIIIIKLVPEVLSEAMSKIIAATLLASLSAATFARQYREPDPEQRWDSPLIIDEVQKFISAEHIGDAETFFTQTRSLGVGIIGAHQGLYQYSPPVRGAALQSLGGLAILGPIKQDVDALCEAYAETGLSEADFAGIRAREEMLLRFPVADRDSGLLTARPRERPPAPAGGSGAGLDIRGVRPPDHDDNVDDDMLLERLWGIAADYGPINGPGEAAEQLALWTAGATNPEAMGAMTTRLRARSRAYQTANARELDQDQRPETMAARIRERSALRYGIDPVVNACYARWLTLRYPADIPGTRAKPSLRQPARPFDDESGDGEASWAGPGLLQARQGGKRGKDVP